VGGAGALLITAGPSTLDFGGISMGTSSLPQVVTLSNPGATPVTLTSIAAPAFIASDGGCTTVPAGGNCQISLRFTPTAEGPRAALVALSYAGGGPTTIAATGTGERSLVTHYYRAVLRRAPDAPGKAFWAGEVTRLAGLGADINETWAAMAISFFTSAEYATFNRDTAGFVTDLYATFFNRAPDLGGLAFWSNEIASGMPREVVLAAFIFSPEFDNFTRAIFGDTTARAEIDSVTDFYRGLLGRLPDDGGLDYWVRRFRTSQCEGADSVRSQADAISNLFTSGGEYAGRGRTNEQFVGDLYNAFLRRGGDLQGVQYWIGQVGSRGREAIRQAFRDSAEFSVRMNAMIAQGCVR
jgi:hypothetical protein